jgi:uncharacterized membrane protein YfcA
VLIFIVTHAVRWTQTIELLIGAIIGGYCGALVGRRARSSWIRAGTLVIASSITALFFARTYFNFH